MTYLIEMDYPGSFAGHHQTPLLSFRMNDYLMETTSKPRITETSINFTAANSQFGSDLSNTDKQSVTHISQLLPSPVFPCPK